MEQKQKIKEMNEMMDKMDENESHCVLTNEEFKEIDKMIEEKKLSLENAILLLKQLGYLKTLKCMYSSFFEMFSLIERFERLIIEKEKKKEEKNEKIFVDICESYLLLGRWFSSELLSICIPCLLKVALKKEENEETQKEVEMALLALSCIEYWNEIEQGLFLNEIKIIIQYHQEHHNLTRLAYQSAWRFLMILYRNEESLERLIVNELNFVKEATRELEVLKSCVNWKGNNNEIEAMKKSSIIKRWMILIHLFCNYIDISKADGLEDLVGCIVDLCRISIENYKSLHIHCSSKFFSLICQKELSVDILMEKGVVDYVLEETLHPTINLDLIENCVPFLSLLPRRINEEYAEKHDEHKRELLQRKLSDKLEEEGFSDIMAIYIYF
ncbi:uncharacterized protein MONOS_18553 [Monocercomonoides exilis]|uniref:uncharacterized protein n=1 Tax=Monocercomonoides exilis TaxID=2049356 RepID=UPI003559FDD9|nr:hypothetical protein MONOS_18553 [Monocercomonoides exilis]